MKRWDWDTRVALPAGVPTAKAYALKPARPKRKRKPLKNAK